MADENNFSVDTEQLKNETKDTVNQVKDTIKNTDFKEGAAQAKGLVAEMFANPVSAVKRVASGEENAFSKVVVLMIVWIAASVIAGLISLMKYGKYSSIGNNIMNFVSYVLNPIFYIVVPAIIILIMNKNNKKSLITIISTLTIAAVPTIINSIIDIVEGLVSGITIISGPISTMFSAIALVLTYFGMKDLFDIDEDESFIKKYAIIKLIAAFVLVILARVGIY